MDRAERDAEIVALRAQGWTLKAIGEAVGLSSRGVAHIVRRSGLDGAHQSVAQDDSGVTSVAVCACGVSFIGIGPDRWTDAAYALALHAFQYRTLRTELTVEEQAPKREDFPAPAREPRRRFPRPGVVDVTDAELADALRSGMSNKAALRTYRTGTPRIRRIRAEIEQEAA